MRSKDESTWKEKDRICESVKKWKWKKWIKYAISASKTQQAIPSHQRTFSTWIHNWIKFFHRSLAVAIVHTGTSVWCTSYPSYYQTGSSCRRASWLRRRTCGWNWRRHWCRSWYSTINVRGSVSDEEKRKETNLNSICKYSKVQLRTRKDPINSLTRWSKEVGRRNIKCRLQASRVLS